MPKASRFIVVKASYRELSERFYLHQKRLGYVPQSCRTKQLYLNEFLSWLEKRGQTEIDKVTTADLQHYYQYLATRPSQKEGTLSLKSVFSHLKTIEQFFILLHRSGEVEINPVSIIDFNYPKNESNREILTQSEITQLYKVCISAWERSILSLGYGCGLRVGELEQVNIEDVKLRDKLLIVPKGKGNKRRVIPMSKGVVNDLSDYYYQERERLTTGRDYLKNSAAFMLNSRGGRMREYTYNKHLKRIIQRTENDKIIEKKISMHNLRHSIATHLIQQGISVEQVRQFLGHSQLETTQLYTHINKTQLKSLLDE